MPHIQTMTHSDPDSRSSMSRQQDSQFSRPTIMSKREIIFSQKKNTFGSGLYELEMMESFRNWIEDQKGDEYHRYQTFDFIFSTNSDPVLVITLV